MELKKGKYISTERLKGFLILLLIGGLAGLAVNIEDIVLRIVFITISSILVAVSFKTNSIFLLIGFIILQWVMAIMIFENHTPKEEVINIEYYDETGENILDQKNFLTSIGGEKDCFRIKKEKCLGKICIIPNVSELEKRMTSNISFIESGEISVLIFTLLINENYDIIEINTDKELTENEEKELADFFSKNVKIRPEKKYECNFMPTEVIFTTAFFDF